MSTLQPFDFSSGSKLRAGMKDMKEQTWRSLSIIRVNPLNLR